MKLFFSILFALYGLSHSAILLADSIEIKKPPASLGQWYKPENKRQVFLHTMFKMRRQMQAIREYAEQEDEQHIEKWLVGFEKYYNKISDMIPEWKNEIKPDLISDLKKFTNKKDFYHVALTLNKIQDTCDGCHKDYQPQVAAMYRSPNYKNIRINDIDGAPQNIENNMQDLSMYVNRILISLADGNNKAALTASHDFELQLNNTGDSCQQCHKDEYPRERILGNQTKNNINKLKDNISQGLVKDSQNLMGEIAVTVCARCHSTHKVVFDLRNTLQTKK